MKRKEGPGLGSGKDGLTVSGNWELLVQGEKYCPLDFFNQGDWKEDFLEYRAISDSVICAGRGYKHISQSLGLVPCWG